jgi:hypothetical protein
MRGAHRAFLAGIDEEGKSALQRSMEANQRRLDAELDAETEALVAKISRRPPPRSRIPSSGALEVSKTRAVSKTRRMEEKKPAVKRSTSRPGTAISRPTSRAGTASTRPASRTGTTATSRPTSRAGTAASRPASRSGTTASARPTTSTSRPSSRTHTRTASTADSKKAAELLSQRPRSTSMRTTSNPRPTRPTTATAPIPAPKTIGYHAGRDIKVNVLDAIEQIQREDAEAEELGLPAIIIPDDDDVVIDMPSPLILEEEEEFVFTLGA